MMAATTIVNTPAQCPSDADHTYTTKIVSGKLVQIQTSVLKKITPKGSPGQMVFTNGVLTSETRPT
jgi:hypothetical protein